MIKYQYPYIFKNNNNFKNPVIFVHGFNSSPNCFSNFEMYWEKSNYYALAFPGNNNLKLLSNHEASVYQYAELLIEFILNNDLKDVILIGHSMGGGTISLAYKMRPDLIKKLIFLAPMNKTSLSLKDNYFDSYFPKTFQQYLKFIKNLYYDPSFINDSSWLKEQEKLFNSQDYNNETITKLGKSLPDINLHNDIANAHLEIKVPSLLVLGEKDGVIDRDLCLSYFKKQVKNIKTCWIPKTGHMMFNENFPAFIKIVEDFILDE